MPDAIGLEFGKKLSGALFVEMLNTVSTACGDDFQFLWMNLEKPGHEGASVAFEMPKHADFVGKALFGLWAAKSLMDAAIVADAHLCPQGILHLVHAGGNMAHEEDQASFEAWRANPFSPSRRSCARTSDRYFSKVREPASSFRIILLASGMVPAFVSDTPGEDTRIKEINSVRWKAGESAQK